ncbi:MAG: 16S rRNA (guanine(966)-N(2))-methyltransferase RsmD [Clostridia bacterium]|nr:16S rRNA (guanine(966)-N(2))-methyltransferase RsmD [Clostridia bacterium]
MRIITGKAKGIKLDTLDGLDTRPTSERSKEAIFSMLQFEIEGRVVLDLFAGSGQMGLEALSRGAKSAYLVDSGKRAFEIIKKNIQKTRLEGANALCTDSISFLKRQNGTEKFDIVFLDPPYASELINDALSLLLERELIKETSYIVCESDRFEFLNEKNQSNFEVIKTMKHGIAHISVLKKSGEKE